MFERSREPCPTLLPVYVRAESRTLRYFTPCLCSSGVENPVLLDTMFMFERSREPCPTCLRSSGVENPTLLDTLFTFERSREPFLCSNLSDTMFTFERSREPCVTLLPFMFERSREPCATLLLVYVRAFLTQCLRSSGVENFLLGRRSREPF